MKLNIHLIGLGALGLQMAMEMAKRAAATEKHMQLFLYDFDTVEDRNTFSQAFSFADVGKFKAEVAGEAVAGYPGVEAIVRPWRVSPERIPDMELNEMSVIIDAVDNLETRHFLWSLGAAGPYPVLHMGMSYTGTGSVSWNVGEYDKFPLSPQNISPELMAQLLEDKENGKKEEEVKLPPCDLNNSRALGLNTVHSALDALWIFLGRDAANVLPNELSALKQAPGIMTNWESTILGRRLKLEASDDVGICTTWQR